MGRGRRMADSLRSAHGEWQWRSAGVWAAYERWSSRSSANPALDFAAYRVALDLEERACLRYMKLAERT